MGVKSIAAYLGKNPEVGMVNRRQPGAFNAVKENDAADPSLSHVAEFLSNQSKDTDILLRRVLIRKARSVNDGELGRIGCLLDSVPLAFARAFQA
jgi:hypothetical protein